LIQYYGLIVAVRLAKISKSRIGDLAGSAFLL